MSKLSTQWLRTHLRSHVAWLTLLLLAPPALYMASAQESTGKTATSSTPREQPIPFSHSTHVALHLDCAFCHTNPEPGNQMTLPAAERCMACHARVATGSPAIQRLAAYARTGEPIP